MALKKPPSFLLQISGFSKVSTFIFFLATAGFFALFSSLHFLIVKRNGHFDAPLTDGERFWFWEKGLGRILNQVHLWSVIPAGTLLPLQFLPIVRRKFPVFHRNAGYLLSILLIIGSITGIKTGFHAFGGTKHTILYCLLIGFGSIYGTYRSITSARRYEFDIHRAWALRTWAYATSILTLRIFLVTSAIIYQNNQSHLKIHLPGSTTTSLSALTGTSFMTCAEINYLRSTQYGLKNPFVVVDELSLHGSGGINATIASMYPACVNVPKTGGGVSNSSTGADSISMPVMLRMRYPEEETAFYNFIFGGCGLLGLVVNVVAIESWLRWTRDEGERLRKVGEVRRKARRVVKVD